LAESAPAYNPARARRTIFGALIEAGRAFGTKTPILVDGDERVLTYQDLCRAALALGHRLKKQTASGEAVGVLLPTGMG